MNAWNRASVVGVLLLVLATVTFAGCGSGSAVLGVNVSSPIATVQVGATMQFYATVNLRFGSRGNVGVNWTVTCSSASCGSVSPTSTESGALTTYAAPAAPPPSNLIVTLTANSILDPAKSASAIITVPSVEVVVAPSAATVPLGGTQQFMATVRGDSTNAGVTWSLAKSYRCAPDFGCNGTISPSCENSSCGTFSSASTASGAVVTYTAPVTPPQFPGPIDDQVLVVATSVTNTVASTSASISFPANAAEVAPTANSVASNQVEEGKNLPRYSISILSTLGGTQGQAYGINNKGWIAGDANLPGDQTEHPTVWRDGGVITDLGTLGGPNGAAGFPFKNDRGLIAGFAQTATSDPLGENWNIYCTYQESGGPPCDGTNLINGGFLWVDGVKTRLQTLGGNNSTAATVNNWGQVVGWAETSTVDPSCVAPQVLDFEAVIWTPWNQQIHELQPFPGDVVSGALAINDFGQVVGTSGNCAPVSPAIGAHAVLWQNGSVISLGSLGGVFTNVAYDINNRGQVVGVSDLPGDTTGHAFLWENGKMTDLGTLPGDFFSVAYAINMKGQVVGQSCDVNGNCRAFVWQNGVMTDLNALVPPGSSFYLYTANDINDLGEVVGQAVDPVTGVAPAFSATPAVEVENSEARATQVSGDASTKVILPEKVRKRLQRQIGFRTFMPGPMKQQ